MFKLCLLVFATLTLGPQAVKGVNGGSNTGENEYLYQVFFKHGCETICNGALISHKHVLSSGQCVDYSIRSTWVTTAHVGIKNAEEWGQVYRIRNKLVRNGYDKLNFGNDIGIFELMIYVTSWVRVTIAQLSTTGAIGPQAVLVAGGHVGAGGPHTSLLQKLTVAVMESESCKRMLANAFDYTTHLICTTTARGGITVSDGGGSLIQDNKIIGILVGNYNGPIFTNVSQHLDWISPIIYHDGFRQNS